MRTTLIVAFLLCLAATSCNSDVTEGQSTLSPNKKWFVDMETGSSGRSNVWTRLCIYDTDVFTALKARPNPDPSGTPTASYTVPIELYARDVDLKWNSASTVLRIEQPELNGKPPISYSLDLISFSFSKVEQ